MISNHIKCICVSIGIIICGCSINLYAQSPQAPTNLTGVVVSSTQVNLTWQYSDSYTIAIPTRSPTYMTASQFISYVSTPMPLTQRETAVYNEITKGNVPDFNRTFVAVFISTKGVSGVMHSATYWVLPEYLALGSDQDFIRMPMMPQTAQRLADLYGCLLTTRKMTDTIWLNGVVKLSPKPMSTSVYDITAPSTFFEHHKLVEQQRAGKPNGVLTVGTKKNVVISKRLETYPDRVAIYGWHYLTGSPIQPLSTVHTTPHVDYSHGIRFVRNKMIVDGAEKLVSDVLKDAELYPLMSDEGAFINTKYSTTYP